ncbi:flagella basal body P-ring formation protein FlgA [Halobacteriovorax sp.]|uniref:flagella basal body P-ring formation protein FlgA n=1 Tax=Halobacteriovorax sp. TaxID=2020862 RepID=UPI003562117F
MIKIFIAITLLSSFSAWSKPCQIDIYPKSFLLTNISTRLTKTLIKKSNCDSATNNEFIRFLIDTKGNTSGNQISRVFSSLVNKKVKITPDRISIFKLEDYLTEKLSFTKSWYIRNIKAPTQLSAITLEKNENLNVDCPSCSYPGNKSIRLVINNTMEGTNKYHMLNAKLQVKTLALVPRGIIKIDNQPLSKSMFKKEEVFTENPSELFTNIDSLVFYKVNKSINNRPILINDLVAVSLVKAGMPTSVVLDNGVISLKSTAMPLRSAKFGETVQLRSSRSNKIIVGKVIDYNKVSISL